MSEIAAFFARAKALGPIEPGEESIKDFYDAYGEELPEVHGLDLSTVPGELYHDLQAALYEHQELAEEQARIEYEAETIGRAAEAGVRRGMQEAPEDDYDSAEGEYYRIASPQERVVLDSIKTARRNIDEYAGLKEEAESVGDEKEVESMKNLIRFEREKLAGLRPSIDAMIQKGKSFKYESGVSDYMAMSPAERQAFDQQYPGHSDEAFREQANATSDRKIPQKTDSGPVYVLHPRYSGQEVMKRLKENAETHAGLADQPDFSIAITAKEIGHPLMSSAVVYDPNSPPPKAEDVEREESPGDIEVVSITGPGAPEVTYHDEEEPEAEVDEGPKPKTHIFSRM